jgi:L-alanine-DL-glutamate epimerase-like enolase superfamily enzyme
VTRFDTLLVEAEDDDGRTGLGEATLLTGYTDETVDGAWELMQRLAAGFTGLSPVRCVELLRGVTQSAPFAATGLATAMEMLQASSWLRVTEPARVPLLGVVNGSTARELEVEVGELLSEGFATLKVKVGFDADQDARRVRLIQATVAGRCRLRIDANQGYDRDQGCAFAATLDPEGIELFEQPCAAGDWDAAQAVAAVSPVPMMLDEPIYGLEDIERAARLGAARFIKLKLMKMGSLELLAQGIRRIRELGMEPVLGNGVACEVGCWMEACVARTLIANAGEMNGFQPVTRLLADPLPFRTVH